MQSLCRQFFGALEGSNRASHITRHLRERDLSCMPMRLISLPLGACGATHGCFTGARTTHGRGMSGGFFIKERWVGCTSTRSSLLHACSYLIRNVLWDHFACGNLPPRLGQMLEKPSSTACVLLPTILTLAMLRIRLFGVFLNVSWMQVKGFMLSPHYENLRGEKMRVRGREK